MSQTFVPIAPRTAPVRMEGPLAWLRNNLFSSVPNAVVSILLLAIIAWPALSAFNWAVLNAVTAANADACQAARGTGACWGVITEKGRIILLGRYPQVEQWRAELATFLLLALVVASCSRWFWKPWLALLWAVVLTGAGRGFCAGADLRGGRPAGDEQPSRQERLDVYGWVGRLAMALYRILDKPVIAAVNGVAAGAGMSMALACDMRVGSENTRFKVVFIERSLSPDSGLSFFLPRIVGFSRACDLIYTSRYVDADEAYRIGLLDRLVPADRLLDEALKLANQVASWPPVAMQSSR
ncbi:MAG: enoyl-CoA hydratase/isomerase family protein, partial [Polaromonas sp.]|nr:enoyl-CoA hydratase/isomerase family protein [Polaromonas sp.]